MDWTDDTCMTVLGGGRRADTRRLKVIDTARKLFADHGFHATGIAQIARQSGIAVGQIYRDFASKEDIVAEIVQRDCAAFLEDSALCQAIARGDALAVRAWIAHIVDPEEKNENGRMFAEILAESSRNTRIHAIFQSVQHAMRANLMAALDIFAPGPESAPRRALLTDTIMTFSIGLLHHRLLSDDDRATDLVAAHKRIIDREIDELQHDRIATE